MLGARPIALLLIVALVVIASPAQEPQLVDRSAAVTSEEKAAPKMDDNAQHKFFDRQQLLALYVHSGVRLADTIKTCREFTHGGVEDWIPAQSCGGVAAWQIGAVGLTLGVGWLLHKRGLHRLERITPWVGASASAAGLTKSVFNIR